MSVNKIQPEYLKPGDEVAIVSPSFYIDRETLAEAVTFLEKWDLKVKIGKNALNQNGPFAGSDEERFADLQEMTNNPDIKAVFCSRGGYGISKIIDKIDFTALNLKPKWYVGFSDITVLHLWLSEVCGVMSIHGEMPLNYNNSEKSHLTFATLKQALFGELNSTRWQGTFYNAGHITGEITGGNLSLVYSLIGTPSEPSTKGKILFVEEIGEYYYHIDRMMTSLKMADKLEGLSALLVGGMNDIEEAKIPWGRSIEETIYEIVKEYNYPVLFNFPAGHKSDNQAFFIGREAKISVKGSEAVLSYI